MGELWGMGLSVTDFECSLVELFTSGCGHSWDISGFDCLFGPYSGRDSGKMGARYSKAILGLFSTGLLGSQCLRVLCYGSFPLNGD